MNFHESLFLYVMEMQQLATVIKYVGFFRLLHIIFFSVETLLVTINLIFSFTVWLSF